MTEILVPFSHTLAFSNLDVFIKSLSSFVIVKGAVFVNRNCVTNDAVFTKNI